MKNSNSIILSIYPNTRGFGYMCIELPRTFIRYGVITSRPISNDDLLIRIKAFIEEFKPGIVILRNCNTPSGKLADRSQELVESILTGMKESDATFHIYTRQQIRDVFEILNAFTKQEIALKIAAEFPELKPYIPESRRPWNPEGYQMGIFDAMALIITHKYLTE